MSCGRLGHRRGLQDPPASGRSYRRRAAATGIGPHLSASDRSCRRRVAATGAGPHPAQSGVKYTVGVPRARCTVQTGGRVRPGRAQVALDARHHAASSGRLGPARTRSRVTRPPAEPDAPHDPARRPSHVDMTCEIRSDAPPFSSGAARRGHEQPAAAGNQWSSGQRAATVRPAGHHARHQAARG